MQAVQEYDRAWQSIDCDLMNSVTTEDFREYYDLADCATFRTAVSPGSEMSYWSATNIQTPVLGEQSLGVRAGSRELDSAIDYLWVRSGHNLVHVRMLTGFRADNSDILQEYAEGVLDDLA